MSILPVIIYNPKIPYICKERQLNQTKALSSDYLTMEIPLEMMLSGKIIYTWAIFHKFCRYLPSGELTKVRIIILLLGKLILSMTIFNGYVSHWQKVPPIHIPLNHSKIHLNHYAIHFIKSL